MTEEPDTGPVGPEGRTQEAGKALGCVLRVARGSETQRSVAAALGLSHTTISKLEHGADLPGPATLRRLAEHYDVDPGPLLVLRDHADPTFARGYAAGQAAVPPPQIDVDATFPLDLEAFLAGLDSANHSPASRRGWVGLFFRDMQAAALRRLPPSRDSTPDPLE